MSGLDGLGWPTNDDKPEAGGDCPSAPCCASDLNAVKSWGPLAIADVVGGDLAENTVTLRIHGPMPHTILGAQWFIFHDAPPAAERLHVPKGPHGLGCKCPQRSAPIVRHNVKGVASATSESQRGNGGEG